MGIDSKECMDELINTGMVGHVLIKNKETGEILLDKKNAIHYENMAMTIARALANRSDGHIHEMHFGNGASTTSGTGAITYFPPNIVGRDAELYNQTYYKVVDNLSSLNANPEMNRVDVLSTAEGLRYSDIVITCTLDYNEPSGQYAYDDATDFENDYVFDEIGLKSYSSIGPGRGLLLSHVIFHPILKSLNRIIEIVYTIRIMMC